MTPAPAGREEVRAEMERFLVTLAHKWDGDDGEA